jgi:hypothetical protein
MGCRRAHRLRPADAIEAGCIGGLQVRNGDRWLDIPDIANSFVCNVGDMLERLTHGRYLSALHRVKNPNGATGTATGAYGDYLLAKVAKVFPQLRESVLP